MRPDAVTTPNEKQRLTQAETDQCLLFPLPKGTSAQRLPHGERRGKCGLGCIGSEHNRQWEGTLGKNNTSTLIQVRQLLPRLTPPLFPLRESHLEVAAGKVPDEKDNRRKEAGAHVEENHRGASLVFLKRACEAKGIGCQTEMSAKEL